MSLIARLKFDLNCCVLCALAQCSLRGLMFRSIGLCLQLGMLGLIIGSRADLKWHRLLAGGYAVARASLAIIQLIVARAVPRARVLCLLNAAAGAALVVAPAVTAWREGSEEAYRGHVIVMMATAVGGQGLPVAVPMCHRQCIT